MTRLLITLIMMVATAAQIGAIDFNDESLNYRVTYKWGLIQKNAGRANLTLRRSGNDYHAVLTARSDPWADHIYSVRDTLRSHMTGADMQPLDLRQSHPRSREIQPRCDTLHLRGRHGHSRMHPLPS